MVVRPLFGNRQNNSSGGTLAANHLHALVKQYPEHWGEIRALAERNDHFRAICSDYEAALEAAARWHDPQRDIPSQREQEYLDVAQKLADEILELLLEESARHSQSRITEAS